MLLFVIFRSLDDIHTAVNSLKEQNAHKLMGKGHFRDRKAKVCGVFHAVVKSVGGADNEADLICRRKRALYLFRQFLRGELLALNAHSYLV